MEEKRRVARMRALKGGHLFFNDGFSSRDCTIRNLTPIGAKVLVDTTVGLPDKLLLVFEDETERQCTVRWRKMTELGVEFDP
jgi:hypothetical protein